MAGMVRVPVSGPVVVGAKTTWTKQEALGARGPLQVAPPVGRWGIDEGEVAGGAGGGEMEAGGGEVGEGEEGGGAGAVDGDGAEVLGDGA